MASPVVTSACSIARQSTCRVRHFSKVDAVRICQHRWTIPMAQGTDSLNVAAATAIVLYQLAASVGK